MVQGTIQRQIFLIAKLLVTQDEHILIDVVYVYQTSSELEMVYENKNHQSATEGASRPESVAAILNKMPSERRLNRHFYALTTVIMLMTLFCLCDSLWYVRK